MSSSALATGLSSLGLKCLIGPLMNDDKFANSVRTASSPTERTKTGKVLPTRKKEASAQMIVYPSFATVRLGLGVVLSSHGNWSGRKEKARKDPLLLGSVRVKRCLDTVGVCGSNPHAPTNLIQQNYKIRRLFRIVVDPNDPFPPRVGKFSFFRVTCFCRMKRYPGKLP